MKKESQTLGIDKSRINVGCGQSPTIGWRNFDNSLSVILAKIPLLPILLYKVRLINQSQYNYIYYCKHENIEYANVLRGLPLSNESVEVFYSSHLLEHFDQLQAIAFCIEAKRVLCSGGIIRIAVPDLEKKVAEYIYNKNADLFIEATSLSKPCPKNIVGKVIYIILGPRHHQWMYDGLSLCRFLKSQGFDNPVVTKEGYTQIRNPGKLDLYERSNESVYVEAIKP